MAKASRESALAQRVHAHAGQAADPCQCSCHDHGEACDLCHIAERAVEQANEPPPSSKARPNEHRASWYAVTKECTGQFIAAGFRESFDPRRCNPDDTIYQLGKKIDHEIWEERNRTAEAVDALEALKAQVIDRLLPAAAKSVGVTLWAAELIEMQGVFAQVDTAIENNE